MGVNGRGKALAQGFASRPGVSVAYVCDVDSRPWRVPWRRSRNSSRASRRASGIFVASWTIRTVDVLVVATPNHWHAPATILGVAAGKHVYVEKPCSHTAEEGELALAAARKHQRVVTTGTQRRSWGPVIEAMERLHKGEIGEVRFARSWYRSRRASIGRGQLVDPPAWLDYELWQGPAPRRPFKDNLIHYNWHWHWHWGNGEIGNNGVHALDLARWGMGVDFPTRVTSSGGHYRYDDDQETPDTHLVAFEFGSKALTWEGLSWSPMGPGGSAFGVTFHGDLGRWNCSTSATASMTCRTSWFPSRRARGAMSSTSTISCVVCVRVVVPRRTSRKVIAVPCCATWATFPIASGAY